MEDTQV